MSVLRRVSDDALVCDQHDREHPVDRRRVKVKVSLLSRRKTVTTTWTFHTNVTLVSS